jgi:hypothetical protein
MARFSNKLPKEAETAIASFSWQKNWTDWKAPDNRWELFQRYYKWRVVTHDLDHVHYMKFLTKDYDFERRLWYAMAFGMTYRTPQAFAYTETFPYVHEIDIDELEVWHQTNWRRTTYGTDARYNKGHFVNQVRSIHKWLDGQTLTDKINGILVYDTQRENFKALFKEIQTLYKYGRMTGWLTMQALHDLCDLPIDPEQIMLDGYSPNNDSSLGSIWNGLCALTNQHDRMVGGKYGDYKCSAADVQWAGEALLDFTERAERWGNFKIDSFRRETIWCQYKRLFNEGGSKEYPGHASGDAASRYLYYREHWPEINWSNFREALRSQPGYVKGLTFVSWHNAIFGATGLLMNMSELYDDMPNAYEQLGLNPNEYRIREIWEDDGLKVPRAVNFAKDLKTTPQWFGVYEI